MFPKSLKRLFSLIIVAALMFSFSGCNPKSETDITDEQKPYVRTYTGYAIDALSGLAGVDEDGIDLSVKPDQHLKTYSKAHPEKGYGLLIIQEDGKYKFFKFGSYGDTLANEMFSEISMRSTYPYSNAVVIDVYGIISGDTLLVEKFSIPFDYYIK